MVEQLEKLAQAKASRVDYPCLFDDTNIHSVAQMMDPTARGYITLAQYKEGEHNISHSRAIPMHVQISLILIIFTSYLEKF